jgi:uncharacterized protein YwgA/O-acetyl-ADP-ribose deacetylase (regulator of RNase III)
MAVTTKVGNLFNSGAQTLVNTVNCVGIMGKGIALEFKNRFPEMFADYELRCDRKEVKLGEPYLYRRLLTPWILNFPTKGHWRAVSRLSDIVAGLNYLKAHYKEWGITSLAVPPLGSGQGQLEWRVVGPTLYRHLSQLDIPVELYAPIDTPEHMLEPSFLGGNVGVVPGGNGNGQSKIPPASVALVEILARVLKEPYRTPVGRTTFQKLAYFATDAGLPTDLAFTKASYGPFCEKLKPLITKLVNNGLIQEKQLGRMFAVLPGPTFTDARKEYANQLKEWEPTIRKVADLLLRMDTHSAEVAATVSFCTHILRESRKEKPSESQVLSAIREWKQKRQPPLADEEIAESIRQLLILGWIDVAPSADLPVPSEALLQ